MEPQEIRDMLRTFSAKFVRTRTLGDSEDIFATGVANSLFMMQLVLFVEKTFSLKIENSDLQMDNFRSIASIAAFVAAKKDTVAMND